MTDTKPLKTGEVFDPEEETLPGVDPAGINAIMPIDAEFEPAIDDDDDMIQDDDTFFDDDRELVIIPVSFVKPRTKQVVYGFYGLGPEDYLKDTWWAMSPQRAFRTSTILAWPLDKAFLTRVKVGQVDQLVQEVLGIDAEAFKSNYSLDLMIDRYFDAKSKNRTSGIEYLVGEELDGRHEGMQIMLDTACPGLDITIEFKGKLRGLLVIGDEVLGD